MSAGESAGSRLLTGEEASAAARRIMEEVRQHLAAALHGPIGAALAATAGDTGDPSAPDGARDAQMLLGAPLPRMFMATGAAVTIGYTALSEGDEARVAGALLCARRLLFPDDASGLAGFVSAARRARDAIAPDSAPEGGDDQAIGVDAASLMQRRVAAGVDALERARAGAVAHLEAAALGSASWKRATGGAGPASDVMRGHLAPFLHALVRWAFLVEAALDGIERDDWARAGAALVAARSVTSAA